MNKVFLNKIEKVLQERRQILLKKPEKVIDIDIDGDETDEIQGKILAHITAQITVREIHLLDRIERALSRIQNGTFGKCEECEEAIAEKRLLINPEFTTCISCASYNEMQEEKRVRGIR